MMSSIPFAIPTEFLAGYHTGEILRFGAILKNSATGKIIGHLQETGPAQQILSSVISNPLSPLSLLGNAANLGSNIYTAIQVRQLKLLMESLKAVQVASLGVSLVGVGVSVAGFIYMRKRFDVLDSQINQLLEAVNGGFEEQRKAHLRSHLSRSKALIRRAEQAQVLSDPRSEYMNVSGGLSDESGFFEGEISYMISEQHPINLDGFWQLAQMLLLCNNVRLECQLRANELPHASKISEAIASDYRDLFERITPASFEVAPERGRDVVRTLRDATDAAATRPYLIDYLKFKRISGPEYLDALKNEADQPLLVLKTN